MLEVSGEGKGTWSQRRMEEGRGLGSEADLPGSSEAPWGSVVVNLRPEQLG